MISRSWARYDWAVRFARLTGAEVPFLRVLGQFVRKRALMYSTAKSDRTACRQCAPHTDKRRPPRGGGRAVVSCRSSSLRRLGGGD